MFIPEASTGATPSALPAGPLSIPNGPARASAERERSGGKRRSSVRNTVVCRPRALLSRHIAAIGPYLSYERVVQLIPSSRGVYHVPLSRVAARSAATQSSDLSLLEVSALSVEA